MASTAIAAILAAGVWTGYGTPAYSSGESRMLSLYHVHTRESLTVTYMVNGKYIPSALKKINYLMRDWRRKEVIKIDPETVDLMWELHADLGSQRPIHIICGYRSPRTNAFLKKVGRNVARKSQHMIGKAIDLYFPDVPAEKIRNSALVRKVGGVGYYRSSGGPTGFVHIDSGNVRHWGPAISSRQMAKIMRDYRKTVGARVNRKDRTLLAAVEPAKAAADGTTLYDIDDEELAELSAAAGRTPDAPKAKPADQPPQELVQGYPVPKPRPKPIEVLLMAAMNMKIEPASAPPPTEVKLPRASSVSDGIGTVDAAETMLEESGPVSNATAKGSLAASLRDGTEQGLPMIKSITASAAGDDLFWWPQQVIFNGDKAVRRDGAPPQFSESENGILPGSAAAAQPPARALQMIATGKGDMLVVNREGKGNLMPPVKRRQLSQPQED